VRKEINNIPGSMSFFDGLRGPPKIDKEHHYTDYKELQSFLINLDYSNIDYIDIGLAGDMKLTGGTLFSGKKFNEDCYFYDNSCWAEPCIVIYYKTKPVETIYFTTNKMQNTNLKKIIKQVVDKISKKNKINKILNEFAKATDVDGRETLYKYTDCDLADLKEDLLELLK